MNIRQYHLQAILAAAAISLSAPAWAQSQTHERLPLEGGSFAIGAVHGVGYYIVEPEGLHVVMTLTKGAEKPVRFEATLAEGQSLTLSSPRQEGEAAESIVVQREGDKLVVTTNVDAPPIEVDEDE